MNEDYLHYLWVNKKLPFTQLQTHQKENLEILNFGQYLQLAGPDVFNAQIRIDQQIWAGNIEIHVKSSDWYLHHHEKDNAYDNVILHVVWEHDTPVFRKDNTEIPTLELNNYINQEELIKYKNLLKPKSWIKCENQITEVDTFIWDNFKEKLILERLERKANEILVRLKETSFDWEQVFFEFLAKNFGLNTNGNAFLSMARNIGFTIIRKERGEVENLEALFFGCLNLLQSNCDDFYFSNLKNKWEYYKLKYQLTELNGIEVSFFKHRPDNFPTIRLAQLAQFLFYNNSVFDSIITFKKLEDIQNIFKIAPSIYWNSHYNFCKSNSHKIKKISSNFTNLVVVNTIIPFRFCYEKERGNFSFEELLEWLKQMDLEKNSIVDKFQYFNINLANCYDSQAVLQLKNEYCNQNKCLQCAIGLHILKK